VSNIIYRPMVSVYLIYWC